MNSGIDMECHLFSRPKRIRQSHRDFTIFQWTCIRCLFVQEKDMNDIGLPTMRYSDADYRVLDRFQVQFSDK